MNIKVQCCGIALLAVIMYFHRKQKKVNLNTEKAFLAIFYIIMASVVLDVLSLAAIYCMDSLPAIFVDIACKSYNVTLIWVALSSFTYVCMDVYKQKEKYAEAIKRCLIPAFTGSVLVYLLPIYYYEEDKVIMYTYGPSIIATYAFGLSFVAATCYFMIRHRKQINRGRCEAVRFWLLIWLGASVIQLFVKNLFIVGYASSIGVLVLYLKLENPETNLDRQTGLFNNNALVYYVRQLYDREKSFSAVCMILDYSANKVFQTVSGKQVMIEVADCLLRLEDVMSFKNSEDEIFMIFKDEKAALETIDMLNIRFKKGFGTDGAVTLFPSWICMPDSSLAEDVDELLYLFRHKRMKCRELVSGYSVTIDWETVLQADNEKKIENLIVEAMEKDKVEVFYQPIYSTKEKCFTSAEALVRIRDSNGEIIPPGMFIEVAEKSGMILRLGKIVFEKVCRFLKEDISEKYGIHYIEVNLSVVQCAYENLAQEYIEIMQKYSISPKLINLEITESASLSAKKTLLDNMQMLMDYGVKFSLDDFGTGQSNLNYIVDMPVDIVKFDRQMSNAYFENGKAKYVMDAAMHMIHGMQLEIVSEGIETKEQYQTMEGLGISYIQGYYFSKPLPEKDFLRFMQMQGKI